MARQRSIEAQVATAVLRASRAVLRSMRRLAGGQRPPIPRAHAGAWKQVDAEDSGLIVSGLSLRYDGGHRHHCDRSDSPLGLEETRSIGSLVMNALRLLLSLALVSVAVPLAAAENGPAKENLRVYLLIGQSNMAGRAAIPRTQRGPSSGATCSTARTSGNRRPIPLNRYSTARKGLGMQRLGPGTVCQGHARGRPPSRPRPGRQRPGRQQHRRVEA